MRPSCTIALACCLALLAGTDVHAQNPVHLDWRVVETDHFWVYYHQGEEQIAQLAAQIAEDSYGPLTLLYQSEPDGKVHLVLKDSEDISNGAAYYNDNLIEVWATPLEFDLRGTHDWLQSTITHELAHIVSLHAARKVPRRVPAVYLQWLEYQEETREDVLRGYPNVMASYPVPAIVVPNWFAEGVAQYQADGARHDAWDTHRDMVLRMAVLNDQMLTLDEMGGFGKNTLGNEMVYDHGFSLVRFISQHYGDDKLRAILQGAQNWRHFDFDNALKSALGISGKELYQRWKASLEEHYQQQAEAIGTHLIEGEPLHSSQEAQRQGYSNTYPVWSPDGKCLAYVSNKGQDYYLESLYVLSPGQDEEEHAAGAVSSGGSWTPSGEALIFSKRAKPDRYGARFWDIFRHDLGTKKTTQLTHKLRAQYPDCSPDGKKIVFVKNEHGQNNLGVCDIDGANVRYLTAFAQGVQLFHPKWSPGGSRIVFSVFREGHRDVAVIDSTGEGLWYVAASPGTDRDPCWSPDGRHIVFASDVGGIFNLYTMDLESRRTQQLTNVLGGAFSPAVSPSGDLAFSLWGAHGQEIRILLDPEAWRDVDAELFQRRPQKQGSPVPAPARVAFRDYKRTFVSFSLIPRLTVDSGRLKVGAYGLSRDVLDKQSLIAGATVGGNLDVDGFALYEYNSLLPTLFLEYYHQTRHTDQDIPDSNNISTINQIIYNLNEVDFGARYKLWRVHECSWALIYSMYKAKLKGTSLLDDGESFVFRYTYLHGVDLAFTYRYRSFQRLADDVINPRGGREVFFRYDRMYNYFLEDFETSPFGLEEDYAHHFYHQFSLDWKEHLGLPWRRNTLGFRLKLGYIDRRVDPFFKFHLGGPTQMRGYTYYSLEGRKIAMGSAMYRFPILRSVRRKLGWLYFDKLYASVFADVGRAWDSDSEDFKARGFKRDVGAELRLDLVSHYSFPLGVSLEAAYALDEEQGKDPLKWYFSLLFGYPSSVQQ